MAGQHACSVEEDRTRQHHALPQLSWFRAHSVTSDRRQEARQGGLAECASQTAQLSNGKIVPGRSILVQTFHTRCQESHPCSSRNWTAGLQRWPSAGQQIQQHWHKWVWWSALCFQMYGNALSFHPLTGNYFGWLMLKQHAWFVHVVDSAWKVHETMFLECCLQ